MSETLLLFSNQLADVVAAVADSVVQVQGHRAPVSGVVYRDDVVITNARALGREDGLHVKTGDGRELDAELHGWDPATGLAVLRVEGLGVKAAQIADQPVRVGNLAIAVARSWSNNVTASNGIIAIIGGPLRTGRGKSVDEVIRTNAPMHEGFAGGAFADMSGRLIGVATAASIRGLGVIIPARIAVQAITSLLEHGRMRRGYLGVAGQPVNLGGDTRGVLVADVRDESPAKAAGLLVGDIIVALDGQPVESPEDLLELLSGDRVGKPVAIRIVRGGETREITATAGERTH
jgi:serine protease Do